MQGYKPGTEKCQPRSLCPLLQIWTRWPGSSASLALDFNMHRNEALNPLPQKTLQLSYLVLISNGLTLNVFSSEITLLPQSLTFLLPCFSFSTTQYVCAVLMLAARQPNYISFLVYSLSSGFTIFLCSLNLFSHYRNKFSVHWPPFHFLYLHVVISEKWPRYEQERNFH